MVLGGIDAGKTSFIQAALNLIPGELAVRGFDSQAGRCLGHLERPALGYASPPFSDLIDSSSWGQQALVLFGHW